jgi:hypothetical protein
MPFTVADGPPGLMAAHTWNTVINLNTDVSYGYPRYVARTITDFYSAPEADDNKEPRTARRGELPLPSSERGKTIQYEGEIIALTATELVRMANMMRSAFRERSFLGQMRITPHPTFGGPTWFYMARTVDCKVDDEIVAESLQAVKQYKLKYAVSLRQFDPRFYVEPQVEHHSGEGPILTNSGTASTDPVFILNVPGPGIGDVTIGNDANAAQLTLRDVPTGNYHVDFAARTIVNDQDNQDYTGMLDGAVSDWWDQGVAGLLPGDNHIWQSSTVSGWQANYYSAA